MQARRIFIAECQQYDCGIDEYTMTTIAKMSDHNFARLRNVAGILHDIGLLDTESLALAVERVTRTIPALPASHVSISVSTTRTEYRVDQTSFFFASSNTTTRVDYTGGQSTIRKGYQQPNIPIVTMKHLSDSDDAGAQSPEQVAKRESKYAQLLGRHPRWFVDNEGPAIVADFVSGESVDKADVDFTSYSYARRLRWLACCLRDLNLLHQHYRLHADVKPGNCVLDVTHDTMKLIDFGTTQKVDSSKTFPATMNYIDAREGKPKRLASDMYAMGFILAKLFPEIFWMVDNSRQEIVKTAHGINVVIKMMNAPYTVNKRKRAPLTPANTAIVALKDALMEPEQKNRCTCEQALSFCDQMQQILSASNTCREEDAERVLGLTINRNVYQVEDALRGSKRAEMFGAVNHLNSEVACDRRNNKRRFQ